jgi:signal peptidase I
VTATTEAPADPAPANPEKEKPSASRNLVEWVVILGGALLVAFVVKTFLFQAFFIPSPSMVPTLEVHDRVLVNKLSYRLHDVHRGDVVVFERPPNDAGTIRDLIKRVVAVEGDTIETRGDTLFVNDKPVREPYVKTSSIGGAVTRRTIPQNQVFVMGDNRTNSSDSRVFGPIDEDAIVGRAFVKIWPIKSLGLL